MNPDGCPTSMTRNGEHDSIGTKSSAASSVRSITATLFNGKQLEIQYTFDPSRSKGDHVLIAKNCLLSVTGDLQSKKTFMSIPKIVKLVKKHVHFNTCSASQYASCRCHLPWFFRGSREISRKLVAAGCKNKHFHHYCSLHVASWFKNYLILLILSKESRKLFDREFADIYPYVDLEERFYSHRDEEAIPEFLLERAFKI